MKKVASKGGLVRTSRTMVGTLMAAVVLSLLLATPQARSQTVSLSWQIPTLTPTPESNPTQLKEGISLMATPVVYKKDTTESHTDARVGSSGDGTVLVCRTFTPAASVSPRRLAMTMTIVNGLDRVFRSAGAVISLNVDGSTIAFDQSGIKEFLDVVVLPRGQAQVTVWGPPLSVLRDSGTVALFVFDVVTAVDAAGTPTKKQNFTWYYSYKLDTQTAEESIRTEKLLIDPRGNVSQAPASVSYIRCPRTSTQP